MLDTLLQWFVNPGFMPHSFCLLKNPAIMTLHVASDGLIALAYFSIPIALANFVRRRKDLVFSETILLFAVFILSCGTTHLLDIWILWQPDYLLQGSVKALTAGVSIVTAVLLWPVLEKALALPSPSQLAAVNEELLREANLRQAVLFELESEVSERRQLEARLRESERLLKTVLDTAADGILTTDGQGRIELSNPAVARMFGYDITDLSGMEVSRLMKLIPETPMDDGGSAQSGSLAAESGHEFLGCRQDGSTFPLEVTVGGNTRVLRDITQRKASEAAIRELNANLEGKVKERTKELAIASAAKSQFLANMSHEIRTPLNVILGLAQVLERDALSAEQRELLDRMREAGEALLHLINDILDLSKIESGHLSLEDAPFELAAMLNGLDHLVRDVAEQKGLEFAVQPAPDCPGHLVGDAGRVRQVLINLCGNAIKFTHQGHVKVSTFLTDLTPLRAHLRFEVEDTGIGIAPEALANLFKPFTQADESITRRFGGTGLGLSISKRLVEYMGGRLGAVSQVDKGSTFWFELSFGRAESAPPTPVAIPPARGQRLAGCKVLVVDDNRMNQFLVEKALKLEGAKVSVAANGLQALDYLRAEGNADVVLMDIQMPVMDGLTATREIRSDPRLMGLPVIALTAGALTEDRQKALDAGIDDFLTKPVNLEQMVASILGRLPGTTRQDALTPPTPLDGKPAEHIEMQPGSSA